MNLHRPDISKILEFKYPDFINYIYPSIELVDKVIKNESFLEKALELSKRLYNEWCKTHRPDKSKRIITDQVKKEFINETKLDQIVELSESEIDRIDFLISYCLGLYCNSYPNDLAEFILFLGIDDDYTGFLQSFNPTREVLRQLISKDYISQSRLLKNLVNRRRCDESIEIWYEGLDIQDKLKQIENPYFEGEFYCLYEFFSLPVNLLLKIEAWDILKDFLLKYSLPHFQYQIICILKTNHQILRVFQTILASDIDKSNKLILSTLLRKYWMENLLSIQKNYTLSPSLSSPKKYISIWEDNKNSFEKNLHSDIKETLRIFIEFFNPQEMSKWLFSKPVFQPPIVTVNSKAENQIISECKEILINLVGMEGFDKDYMNLAYISEFMKFFTDKDCEFQKCEDLLSAFFRALSEDRFYLSGSLDDTLISKIHVIANFLETKFDNRIEELYFNHIERFSTSFEGIKTTPLEQRYNKTFIESCFLLVMLYLSASFQEDQTAENLFTRITHHTLNQSYWCGQTQIIENSYLRVLLLAELIADQYLPQIKEEYESKCIDLLPDLEIIVRIFSQSKHKINDRLLDWLREKRDNEWNILKNKYQSRLQQEYVKQIDNFFLQIC